MLGSREELVVIVAKLFILCFLNINIVTNMFVECNASAGLPTSIRIDGNRSLF